MFRGDISFVSPATCDYTMNRNGKSWGSQCDLTKKKLTHRRRLHCKNPIYLFLTKNFLDINSVTRFIQPKKLRPANIDSYCSFFRSFMQFHFHFNVTNQQISQRNQSSVSVDLRVSRISAIQRHLHRLAGQIAEAVDS